MVICDTHHTRIKLYGCGINNNNNNNNNIIIIIIIIIITIIIVVIMFIVTIIINIEIINLERDLLIRTGSF